MVRDSLIYLKWVAWSLSYVDTRISIEKCGTKHMKSTSSGKQTSVISVPLPSRYMTPEVGPPLSAIQRATLRQCALAGYLPEGGGGKSGLAIGGMAAEKGSCRIQTWYCTALVA